MTPGSTVTNTLYNLFQLSLHLLKLCYRSSWCNFQHQISQLYGRYLIDVRVSSVRSGILSVLFIVSSPETKECLVHGVNSVYICCLRIIRSPIISVNEHRLARYTKVLIPRNLWFIFYPCLFVIYQMKVHSSSLRDHRQFSLQGKEDMKLSVMSMKAWLPTEAIVCKMRNKEWRGGCRLHSKPCRVYSLGSKFSFQMYL